MQGEILNLFSFWLRLLESVCQATCHRGTIFFPVKHSACVKKDVSNMTCYCKALCRVQIPFCNSSSFHIIRHKFFRIVITAGINYPADFPDALKSGVFDHGVSMFLSSSNIVIESRDHHFARLAAIRNLLQSRAASSSVALFSSATRESLHANISILRRE